MKLDILFHYEVDESTGAVKFIGKEEVKVDTAKTTSKSTTKAASKATPAIKAEGPIIILESNKFTLTQEAIDLMGVCADCRIDIKYKKKDKQSLPVIGTDVSFGTKGGNKLTKSNTVSYRGSANEKLAQYGNTFKLEPTEDEGIFWLIGDKSPEEPEIPEEIVNIENELDIVDIENIDEDEVENFDFNL